VDTSGKVAQPRKQYLIDRKFQLRFAMELMVLVLLVPFIVWANFYVLGQYAMSIDPAVAEMGSMGMTGALLKHQWPLLLLVYVFNFGLVYGFIVYYTHRIAGPVYRFDLVLGEMAEGKLGHAINLRKRDYFGDVGRRINDVAAKFGSTIMELKEIQSDLARHAETTNDETLRKHAQAAERIISQYEMVTPESGDVTDTVDDSESSTVPG
jgi:methyl-accepting chemotaxis protein